MKTNQQWIRLTRMVSFLSFLLLSAWQTVAQSQCNNICQKTTVNIDCQGIETKTVEFLEVPCDQQCEAAVHTSTDCPCTWEMWQQFTETDCDGETVYAEQKVGDFPCGTDPNPDQNTTVPCVLTSGSSSYIHIQVHYEVRPNGGCLCNGSNDISYQYIDMGCHLQSCMKKTIREFSDGFVETMPSGNFEIPCPGMFPPDEIKIDTIFNYDYRLTTTYYNCDDPETIDFVDERKGIIRFIDCSEQDSPVTSEIIYEECQGLITEKDFKKYKLQRKVVNNYEMLKKEVSKTVIIRTVCEPVSE